MKNVPNIDYRPAMENPIGGAVSLFLGIVALFFVGVTIMNLGNYGYVMRLDNYVPLVLFILFFSIRLKVCRDEKGLAMIYSIYGLKLMRCGFESMEFIDNDKFSIAWIKNGEKRKATRLVVKKTERDMFRKIVEQM